MAQRLVRLCVIVASSALLAWGAPQGSIRGQAVDASGGSVAGASVTATNTTTGIVTGATTDSQGQFQLNGLAAGRYLVAVTKIGFTTFTKQVVVQAGQQATADAKLSVQAAAQSVEVRASAVPGATLEPSPEEVLKSNQTVRVLGRKEMDAVGPLAGASQIISMAPGANVTGYGATGQTKATIAINGINQGWGGYGGYTYPGSLGVTLDGIPIVDAGSGLWPSASLPQTGMFQNTNVTYGPGDPVDRYYTSVGGSIEFTPVQPASKAHIDGNFSFGSYSQKNLELNMLTGLYHGWSTVVSGGLGKGDSFRTGQDGFANPGRDGAIFVKTTKSFQTGIFSVGGYYARAGGYRAQVIPTTAVPGLTVDGLNVTGAQIYSQPTSGFYSTLPFASYNKYDVNELATVYAKETFLLSSTTGVENDTWYTYEFRLHRRLNDVYVPIQQEREYNNPHHNTVGDRLVVSEDLPFNKVSEGGYFLHDIYNSRNNFYNPALGGDGVTQIVNIGGKVRSSYFIQDNYAGFVQDDFHPVPWLHITPGVRFDRYGTSYYSGTLQDFTFAPGVLDTLTSHCDLNGVSITPNVPVVTVDQGSSCGAKEARTAVEPSVNAAVQPRPWLTLYGGYVKTYRSPSLGGGGGIFQNLNPDTNYILASGAYYQGGFKFHVAQFAHAKGVQFGAAYYHLRYANEQLSVELGNGNVINTAGSSNYRGVNAYFDVDPVSGLHLFTNLNGEGASYDQFFSGNVSFVGLPVPYVPTATWNTGAYYSIQRNDKTIVEPRFWFQYVGSQHIFDNCGLVNGACTTAKPSTLSEPSYQTTNLSVSVPFKFLNFSVNMLNLFDQRYNIYQYISAGGYYGTSTAGYTFAYPGAPFTVYANIGFHF
ncbi:MAG TPA: TonB-dependent receptor [Terriglobia bacterium]|nr:TonB-dependent receptor [Terriglobia bacterium]